MKTCPKCNAQIEDNAMFCNNCGFSFQAQQQPPQGAPMPNGAPVQPQQTMPYTDPYDHTAEFNPQDVSENKMYAILVYLLGLIGVAIALIAKISTKSPYLNFHIKEGLKLAVVEVIVGLAAGILCWTCLAPFAAGVCVIILLVVRIICFFKVCGNKSVEAPIVRSFGFLK